MTAKTRVSAPVRAAAYGWPEQGPWWAQRDVWHMLDSTHANSCFMLSEKVNDCEFTKMLRLQATHESCIERLMSCAPALAVERACPSPPEARSARVPRHSVSGMAIHHATASTLLSSLRARGQARISRGRAPRAAVQAQTAAPPWEQAPIAESHPLSKVCLKGLTCRQLADWCESIGERRARGMHIWRCVAAPSKRRDL